MDITARTYPSVTYAVGQEELTAFAAATGRAWGAGASGIGQAPTPAAPCPVAAPTFVAIVAQRAEAAVVADPEVGIDFARVLHAAEVIALHEPIRAGDKLQAEPRIKRLLSRAGTTTLTTETTVTGPRGLAAVVTSTLAMLPPAAAPEPPTAPPSQAGEGECAAAALTAASLTPVTLAVPSRATNPTGFETTAAVHLTHVVRYAGASGDFNPIHHNPVAARLAGLPGTIAHGMLTLALAANAAEAWAGAPGAVQEVRANFTGMVPIAPERATDLALAGTASGAKVNLSVTCAGEAVLGRAIVTLRPAAS
ncbi:MaoC/PaaZ C-terminal domain-containing protein [Buchananella hordeovulneris]|uniref:MaoC/PaaZ C-terminal domain-containing protein n=1 Tax=Buchananella hordeovulneris TaxID=52770 RepID=UPI000F6032FC|nr:MaoC/PaaZ C-terminal domain-containing protein [Buchananella hordeovulneris]RRD43797.1 hypothetical protein EII13_05845 [Buchananella hordeovulneris]